ncbi:MAG: hypothetical protein RLZZ127_2522 [Planctomycetota bacterium]|jgi:hypothetical protein
MTLRGLRNQAVFWSAGAAAVWLGWKVLGWGLGWSLLAAFPAALVVVLVVAVATDPFLD